MTFFSAPVIKRNLSKASIFIIAFYLLNTGVGYSQTVTKTLYLSDPGQGLDRSNPSNPVDNTTSTSTVIGQVVTPNAPNGIAQWHQNGTQTPFYRIFNGNSGTYPAAAANSPTVGNNKASVMISAQSPTNNNVAFMAENTNGKSVRLQQWNGSSWSDASFSPLGAAQNLGEIPVAIAFSDNGNAMLVWDNDANDNTIHYRTWNGTTWSAESTFSYAGFGGNNVPITQMRLAAKPGSTEMTLVFFDNDDDSYATVWNGSSWGNGIEISVSADKSTVVNVSYESTGAKKALVVFDNNTTGNFLYRIWNGTAWSSAVTQNFPSGGSNKPEVTSLSSDPNSARILLGLSTSDNQSIFMLWNGTAFSSASQDNLVIASIGRAKNYSPISVAFEGVSGNGLGVTNTSTDNVRYTTWNSSIGWSSITTGPGFGGTPRIIELYPQPGTNKIMVLGNTDQSDIYSSLWNGTSWGTATALELNTGLNGSDGQGKPFTFFWQLATNTTVNTPTTSFTMGTPLCSAITLPAGGAITAEAFLSFSTGTLTDASSYNINAVLKYGATVIATLNPATYSSASGGKLSWSGVIGASPVTVPAGQAITLEITVVSYTAGVSFAILYDSDTKPSKVNLPVAAATAITISSYAVYDAASGGNIINTAIPIGTTAYPRVVVSDPFGFDDITGLSINIPGTGNVEATSTATAGCTRTYQYTWVVSGSPGSVSIPATAREGLEGTVTAVQPLTVTLCTPITTPAFTAPVTNTRCQAGGTLTYTATSTGSVTYTLDATTLAFAGTGAPNSINASTGVVTYASGWTGASTITATATGCAGPKSATFVTTTVGTPVFASGATSTRCIGSAIVTYSATAANGTVTYSLIPSGTGAGQAGTINVNTGAVTYNAVWAGVATITAAPVGCPSNTTVHSATTNAVVAVADVASTLAGAPVEIDVLANDLCDKNPASISIVGQPTSGNIVISNGKITYVPSGNTTYTDVFTYQVCSNTAPGVCSTATVTVSVTAVANDICAESRTPKTFYLPFPESNGQLEKAIKSAGNTIGNTTYTNARSIFSIKINYPGEVVTYDQWEDGYESNILQPTQSTTQVWGDGNLSNGIAPGYPTDIIPAGGYIILDNLIPYRSMDNAASSPNFYYDGRDKVYTTADATIAVIKGDVSIFDVQNVKASVVDITRFGKSFTIPFGEDVSDIDAFKYTSLFIRASQNNTTVQLDYDGNGTIDQTKMLNEGEVWFYDGTASVPGVAGDINNANDIKSGALVTADKPVGVDLVFGGIDNYGTRNVAVLPGEFYGNTYYTPVYKTQSATPGTAPVRVYLTNTSSSPITVTITNNVGSPPSVVIPAKGYVGYTLTAASGYKFASTGGQSFTAVSIQDADNAGSAYDWAFNMIPEERLGTLVSTAWAPGGNPISSSYNYAPVWVTPVAATTFYVKYDGNLTGTGLLGNTPILGLPYDLAISATTLNSYRIVNPSGDNSGLAVFTENNVKFAGAWGEDPERTLNVATPGSSPAQDVGYVLTPKCLSQNIFAGDDFATTPPSTPVNIPILLNDAAFLATINPSSVTTTGYLQPKNGTAVINPDGTLTYTPNFGFTGKDTLVYNVCLLNYPTTCDVATVIITVTACPAGTNQNLISGKVAVDLATANGVVDAGDPAPRSAVKVDLYVDADCSGTVNGTEAVSQTTFSDYLGNYSFATNGKRAADEFATAAYTNNNGNINWTTNWTETIEATNATAGQMQVIADPSANASSLALRFQGNGTTNAYGVSRSLTFSGATTALLSFRFKRQGFDNGSEALLVKLNGTTIYTISNGGVNGTDPNYTIVSLPLSGFLNNGSNTIQFVVNGSNTFTSTEFFYIDGVELAYGPACYIVKVNPTVPGNPYTASTFSAGNTKVLGSTAFGACITAQNLLVTANLVTSNDNATTAVDVPVVISVLANDAIGYPNSSTVATTGAGITLAAAHGTVLVNPDGTIKYTPNPGFTGTDAFQYRVCSLEDPNICDSSTVVVNIACILTPNNYVINGIVYNDANNSASLTSGELGLASQSVKLYIDANNNSLLDGSEGTTALQSTTTNSVGAYTFTIPQTFTAGQYKDPLNVATTSTGSTGATSWTSNPWTKIGEANAFNAGVIRITANGLIINGNGSSTPPVPNNIYGASRTAPNMLPGGTATLKYDYVESGLDNEAGDFVQVQVSADGSTGWVTLFTHIGTDGNQSGTSANLDISAYMSATTTIRFISSGSTGMSTSNQVRFKNVEINYSTANPVKYIVQLGQPITTGYTLTTPSPSPTGYLVSSMTQSSPSSCSQNFGLLGATVAGKLYDDANGLSGSPTNTVDGAGTNVGGTMYVSLVDASNMVLATVAVAPDGYYSFPNVAPGTYNLAIHQTLAGSAIPALPAGYVYTGEYLANSITPVAGTDGTPNGLLTVIVAGNKVGANFGIEQRPTAGSGVNTVTNPAGSAQVPVPANTFTNTLVSSDPSPGTLNTSVGAAAGLKITAFPTGATSIVVNGTTYTVADLAALQALVIPTDANGNPTVTITVDPTADGITQVSIPFVVVDNAGVQSANSGTAVLNFGTTIKGTVYNDVNGLSPIGTDASISTGNSGTNAGGQVYVSLVN
ncbi:MAG: Ig-like domain-containing protein, partial [Chitinophagaceae bacterium]